MIFYINFITQYVTKYLLNYHLNDAFSFIMAAASKLFINSIYDDFLEMCTVSFPQWLCKKKIIYKYNIKRW